MSTATGGIARLGLIALLALMLGALLLSSTNPAGAQVVMDYDLDDDGLIDVDSLAKLNAIRWDLDGDGTSTNAGYAPAFPVPLSGMGCPDTDGDAATTDCLGYELTADLDFDTHGNDGAVTSADTAYWNGGSGWASIGDWANPFDATFDGGGHTISNLYIRTGTGDAGLFGSTGTSSIIRNLGMVNPDIRNSGALVLDSAAAVAGSNRGTIQRVFVNGGSIRAYDKVGGVVGDNRGAISDSYSSMAVTGNRQVGGLVGRNQSSSGTITNSYAIGVVDTHEDGGTRSGNHQIHNAVNFGGLVGQNITNAMVTASYWDATTSGQAASAGGAGAVSQTTAGLQSPTGATGIYSTWAPATWDFGTASQYPALKYDTDGDGRATAYEFGVQGRFVDYDKDDDGLIDVDSLAKLNAIRWDLDGDGTSTNAGYALAFPDPYPGLGCPDTDGDAATTNCLGYELMADLDFDTDASGDANSADTYWNAGDGWRSIGDWDNPFGATFDGVGHTISNLFIRTGRGDAGLFGSTGTSSIIHNLGMVNTNIDRTGALALDSAAAVAGSNRGTIQRVFVSGGSIWAYDRVGGVVGDNRGVISDSYSRMAVTGNRWVGGLVGRNQTSSGTITNSYAMGVVATHGEVGTRAGLLTTNVAANFGGLVGHNSSVATVTASYWDATTSGQAASAGGAGAVSQTTAGLQLPTDATGIYSAWDAATWDFGTGRQYPALKYDTDGVGGATWQEFGAQVRSSPNYDMDGDNLIEVSNLAQLNAIRWDLNGDGNVASGNQANYALAFPDAMAGMGCAATCTGYELIANLDFDENGDGQMTEVGDPTYWDGGSGWAPIGRVGRPFEPSTIFDGNGYSISHLFIDRDVADGVGLFANLKGTIRNLALEGVNVRGHDMVGALVGLNEGEVYWSYVKGQVAGRNKVGGLVGENGWVNVQTESELTAGYIGGSYSIATVTGDRHVGGLTGHNNRDSVITASYARGAVSGDEEVGGLVGTVYKSTVLQSYAATTMSSGEMHNPLVGDIRQLKKATVPDSYGDTTLFGSSVKRFGKTTTELQAPTDATGIYSNWQTIEVDDSGAVSPWDFGTADQYPVLKVDWNDADSVATSAEFGKQRGSHYDSDDDALIEITTLAQLNAIRWDRNGDGVVASRFQSDYDTAFPNQGTNMGCIFTCRGYELMVDLDFDENNDGQITSADAAYWDNGRGFRPIGGAISATGVRANTFDAVFEGNGNTISNLYMHYPRGKYIGLFGIISSSSRGVRNVILANVSVRSETNVGALAGYTAAAVERVRVISGHVRGKSSIGGLVGNVSPAGSVSRSSSGATVIGTASGASNSIGGLVGELSGSVTASYATGSVTGTQHAGGLVGYAGSKKSVVSRSYATGAVTSHGLTGGLVAANSGHIEASYATGAVSGRGSNGGLVGNNQAQGRITASYARGEVSGGRGRQGGLAGQRSVGAMVTDSYWDAETTGQATSAGSGTTGSKTTSELQTPTQANGYSGIYLNWGDPDDPWDFGSNVMYPVLKADFDGDGVVTLYEFGDVTDSVAPEFTEGVGPVSRSVPENTQELADKSLGDPVGAEDGNAQDTLTYILGGPDAAHFDIISTSGQLQVKDALDFEGKSSYEVTVDVRDGRAADGSVEDPPAIDATITVNISVTDVAEPPDAPTNLQVVTTPGGLLVTWDAPDMAGKPPITGYKVRYNKQNASPPPTWPTAWVIPDHAGTGNSITIGRLTPEWPYRVQVRAINANGPGPYHAPATGRSGMRAVVYVDYDKNNNGLIEVDSLAKLNAIRWDLDGNGAPDVANADYALAFPDAPPGMGCPDTDSDAATSNCTGYELDADLDFNTDTGSDSGGAVIDADDGYWDGGAGWDPIGGNVATGASNPPEFTATFDGGGHTISNLFINRPGRKYIGLFGATSTTASISNVLLDGVNVTGGREIGALVGQAGGSVEGARVTSGQVSGANVIGGLVGRVAKSSSVSRSSSGASVAGTAPGQVGDANQTHVGGLVGVLDESASITASYATGSVTANRGAGGLVGLSRTWAKITRSYATGNVDSPTPGETPVKATTPSGGLVSRNYGNITASYSRGDVTSKSLIGGLIGLSVSGNITASYATGKVIRFPDPPGQKLNYLTGAYGLVGQLAYGGFVNSYFDVETTGRAANPKAKSGVGKTTSELKTPTGYTGIYADWNVDLDGDGNPDDPWDFGSSSMYPVLKADFNNDGVVTSYEFGDAAASVAPVFTEAPGPVSRSVQENTQELADKSFGLPVGAKDANNQDTMIYSLGGADADHFDIIPTTGQLQAKGGLDFEGATTSYRVEVRVTDGRDSNGNVEASPAIDATIVVDISVTNVVGEKPGPITNIKVTPGIKSFLITWTPPDMTGKPPITRYEFQVGKEKLGYESAPATPVGPGRRWAWVINRLESPPVRHSLSYTTGMKADWLYRVRFRARNVDGNGPFAGIFNTATLNSPPTFDDGGSTSFTVTENSGTAVGTVGATDPESDTLTYALDRTSTDHALFNLNTGTGELTLKAAADFEDKSLYSVSVTVHDGKSPFSTRAAAHSATGRAHGGVIPVGGGADTTVDNTIDVTVNVTNVAEPPDAPTNLQAIPANRGLQVTWTAPDMTGKPPINNYKVDFYIRTSADGAPEAWGTATARSIGVPVGEAYSIAGLIPGRTYRVRVQARNSEGDGEWTAYVTGVPFRITDYDSDGNGLIEVDSLAKLNAIRWDLDGNGAPDVANANDYALAFPNPETGMGCPITATDADDNDCLGYELMADLDFDTDASGDANSADTYWNGGSGWTPLGDSGPKPFMTNFDGNNHTISNLFINVTSNSDNYIGLFGQLGGGTVKHVRLVDASVTGNNDVGALVGHITLGTVSHSSSSGTVTGVDKVGGLVGASFSAQGVIEYSYSTAAVTASNDYAGGLIGQNNGKIRASYATGAVTATGNYAGGLAGSTGNSGSIIVSYATGAASGADHVGGLVGQANGNISYSYSRGVPSSSSSPVGTNVGGLVGSRAGAGTIANSYWDTNTSGIVDDSDAATGEGKTTSDLQTPQAYSGIFANWNIDVDNADGDSTSTTGTDDPWDFGTTSEYPVLKVDFNNDNTPTAYEFGVQGRVNTAPTFDDGDASIDRNVNENAGANANVGSPVTATDTDAGDAVTYSLSGTGSNLFSIDSNGQITANNSLNYEATPSFTITVTATDKAGLTDTIVVDIEVGDVDEPPGDPIEVAVVGITNGLRVTWTAPDVTGKPPVTRYTVRYRMQTSADGVSPVAWDLWVGIGVGNVTSHEITSLTPGTTYEVQVRAMNAEGDSDGTTTSTTGVPIAPSVLNAAPVFDDGADTTRSVPENSAIGTAIGLPVSATDTDAGDTLVYVIDDPTASPGSHFAIDSANGQLKVKDALDYESNNRYTIVVTVSDGNGGTASITVTIDVDDVVNEAPVVAPTASPVPTPAPTPAATPVVPTETLAFDEGTIADRRIPSGTPAGTKVGAPVTATGPSGRVGLRYVISTSSPLNAPFRVDRNTGQLWTTAELTAGRSDEFYIVILRVRDRREGSHSIGVSVRVTLPPPRPLNFPPKFEAVTVTIGRSIAENTPPGVSLGSPVRAWDADGDTLAYSLSGADAGLFSLSSRTGQLKTKGALDYERTRRHLVKITASDGRGGTDVINVVILVTNVNEAPVVVSTASPVPTPAPTANRAPAFDEGTSASRSVAENTPAGRNIGLPLTATDPDAGDSLTYELGGADSGHFALSGNQLLTSGALDYEGVKNSYSVTVTVTDGDGASDSIAVTITVTNVINEPPVVAPTASPVPTPAPTANRAPSFTEGASASRSVAENTPAGRNIGLPLAATDLDGDTLTYALGGTDSGHFALSGNQLRTSGALDYEGGTRSYSVTVTVSDGNAGTDSIDVTITVTNVNEAPVAAPEVLSFDEGGNTRRTVRAGAAIGTNVGAPVAATKPDGTRTGLTYRIYLNIYFNTPARAPFRIDRNTGQLETTGELTKNFYILVLQVRDQQGKTDAIGVTIRVTA